MKRLPLFFGLIISLLVPPQLNATAGPTTFSRYINDVFVETGTQYGASVQAALKFGFKEVHSIEILPAYHEANLKRFVNDKRVRLYLGDSAKILWDVIRPINKRMTFWLDGHFSGGGTGKGETYTPILAELEQIARHPIKNHTILIDDTRQLDTVWLDNITMDQLKYKILEINPNYQFKFEDGFVRNDILVAYIP